MIFWFLIHYTWNEKKEEHAYLNALQNSIRRWNKETSRNRKWNQDKAKEQTEEKKTETNEITC